MQWEKFIFFKKLSGTSILYFVFHSVQQETWEKNCQTMKAGIMNYN